MWDSCMDSWDKPLLSVFIYILHRIPTFFGNQFVWIHEYMSVNCIHWASFTFSQSALRLHFCQMFCDKLSSGCFSFHTNCSLRWRCCEKAPCEAGGEHVCHQTSSTPNRKTGTVQGTEIMRHHPLPFLCMTSLSSIWIKPQMAHTLPI